MICPKVDVVILRKFWHPGAGPKSQPPLHTPHALWTSNLALSSSQQYQKREGEVWRGRRFFYLCFTQKIFCAVCGYLPFYTLFNARSTRIPAPACPHFFTFSALPTPKQSGQLTDVLGSDFGMPRVESRAPSSSTL